MLVMGNFQHLCGQNGAELLPTRDGIVFPPPLAPGDRIAVVGAGMVGCCVARLLAGMPGVTVTLVDVE